MPNMLKWCHVLSIASIFYFCQSSQFKFLIYIPFYTLWNVCLVYVTSKWTKKNYSREGHQWFGNPDIKSRHTNDQISPRFVIFSLQKRILSSCPSRFHFGQVHIVWWLSYCQVGKKNKRRALYFIWESIFCLGAVWMVVIEELELSCKSIRYLLWPFIWRRHNMDTPSTLLALCTRNPSVNGGFSTQRHSNENVFFVVSLDQLSNDYSSDWRFETCCRLYVVILMPC